MQEHVVSGAKDPVRCVRCGEPLDGVEAEAQTCVMCFRQIEQD